MKTITLAQVNHANLRFVGVYPMDLGDTLTKELLKTDWYEVADAGYKNLILVDITKVSPELASKLSPLSENHWENGLINGIILIDPRLKIANNDEGFIHY